MNFSPYNGFKTPVAVAMEVKNWSHIARKISFFLEFKCLEEGATYRAVDVNPESVYTAHWSVFICITAHEKRMKA